MNNTQARRSASARGSTQPWQVAAAPLYEQLARDASGELRDRLTDELALAEQDIETVLGREPGVQQAEVLRNLLQAVRLGERLLVQVWDSLHG